MVVRTLLLILLLGGACATVPIEKVPQQCMDECRAVLHVRDEAMKKFERLCIGLNYISARYFEDKNVQREVQEGVRVCDYIYGIRSHG